MSRDPLVSDGDRVVYLGDVPAMKVRVAYTVEVDDFYRRAIRHHYGQDGLATRREVQDWLRQNGSSGDDDIVSDLQCAEKEDER